MIRLSARMPAATADAVIGPLLAVAPLGVHERPHGEHVELVLHGREENMRAARALLGGAGAVEPAPEDGHERLAAVLRPPTVGGVAVRAAWMAPDPEAVDEIVLADPGAFGSGGHPTTRACLDWVLRLDRAGSFADLGCGTGVLAIAAARRGRSPVVAVDSEPVAVEAAAANAGANGAAVEVRRADLLEQPPPAAAAVAANVPAAVHRAIAAALPDEVVELVACGFEHEDASEVASAYAAAGLGVAEARAAGEWVALELRRGAEGELELPPPANAERPAMGDVEQPTAIAARWAERCAHCQLLELGGGAYLDVWPLGDSVRWAVRVPEGTAVEVIGQDGREGRVAIAFRLAGARVDAVVDVGPGPVHALRVAARIEET